MPECIWEDSYDTPENRLVKELVLTLDRKVSKLRSAKAASEDGYVKTRLDKMSKDLIEIVNDRWLMDIGDMRVLPCDSSVLRSRYGYADLFRMYLMLDLGALYKQGDAEGLLKGQNKKLHLVYEYWCYTRLFMCLRDMAEEVLKSPFDLIDEGWTLTIAGHSEFKMRDSDLFVSLYYNRGYSDGLRVLRSYSLRYRLDFTLVIQSQDLKYAYVVNFDAKYRLRSSSNNDEDDEGMGEGIGKTSENDKEDPKEKELREDINKMHTYRDALIYSCGAYVLYLGDSEDPVVYKKREDQQDLETSEVPYIPSVGAIPLSPGKDPVGLRIVLDSVMKNISPLFQGKFNIEDPKAYPLENSKPLNMMEVSAAVIVSGGRVLCFRKGNAKYDYLTGCYEFPGGKLEPGESPKEALIRELNEELDLVLEESELTEFYDMKHDYPDFSVNLHYFIIRKDTLDYTLKEHTDCIRSEPKDLLTLNWAGADLEVAKLLESGSLKI